MQIDRYAEANKYAQRRMDEHLKPIDCLLVKWAPEARHDGAPRWPAGTMLHRIIEQGAMGASQSGKGPILAVSADVEFADWAVSKLRPLKREVVFVEYVYCSGMPPKFKRDKLGLAETAWNHNLNSAREIIYTLCVTYGELVNLQLTSEIA